MFKPTGRSADAFPMVGLPFAAVFATLSLYLLMSSAMAKAGRASPKNRALRAPGGEYRAAVVPPTWLCEHTWATTQRISGPVIRRQGVVFAILAGFCALSTITGFALVIAAVAMPLALLTAWVTFNVCGGQRSVALSRLRCTDFDGEEQQWAPTPARRATARTRGVPRPT